MIGVRDQGAFRYQNSHILFPDVVTHWSYLPPTPWSANAC